MDYYLAHNIHPQVVRYHVSLDSIHNGIPVRKTPILFEEGDSFDVKLAFQRVGHVGFNEYMMFLHEAYKVDKVHLNNEYSGSWSFSL